MADYMTTGITIEESFAYGTPNSKKKLVVAPSGVCDPTMSDTRERLAPWRVSTTFFRGRMAAAGSDIVFPTTSVLAFTSGPTDDAGPVGGGVFGGPGGVQKRSDTNAQSASDGGGAVRSQQAFVMTGLWFQFLETYTVPANDPAIASATNARTAPAWLRSPVAPYNKAIQAALASVINPQLKNGKQTACDFDCLALDMWAQGSGIAAQSIGFGGIGGAFYYLAVPDVSGGQGSGYELQLQLVQDREVRIGSDAVNQTPGATDDVVQALRCVAVGYPICSTPSGGIDYDALAAALAARGGMVQGAVDQSQLSAAMAKAAKGLRY